MRLGLCDTKFKWVISLQKTRALQLSCEEEEEAKKAILKIQICYQKSMRNMSIDLIFVSHCVKLY